ncbi:MULTISPECIES: hypothetical protein [unclassified Xanthomonas]|uniref:hypothetical protein n=1 Tax=unclassified Xanthomonas TaxID=2643310 RepID=UPI001620C857|nr:MULTISPECIES: hypothetical protein [unclassified Xanthomonas]MBB4133290.1 hypothetical protein [Xanthomonas sp. 3075]MBB5866130.1 hypothetical protein [Xanthomonas sp. 3058]
MDKLIGFLVLAVLVSVACAVVLRFVRLHGSLKAIANLLITTAVVCTVVMQDASAPPWNHALLITLFFSVPASLCVVVLGAALNWITNKRRARAPA